MRTPFSMMIVVMLVGSGCSGDYDCNSAATAIQEQLVQACKADDYKTSPFCTVCVAHQFYSIDDSCNCRPLTFDVDFCAYEDTERGREKVGAALDYARSVCQGGACLPKDFGETRCSTGASSSSSTSSSGGNTSPSSSSTGSSSSNSSSGMGGAGGASGGGGSGG